MRRDVVLGKELMMFELCKFKAGSRDRRNFLELHCIKQFKVTQKTIRDRLRLLEKDFKKQDRFE